MHDDLRDVIATAKRARDAIFAKEMSAEDAHAIARNNHTINVAHRIALEERIFAARLGSALAAVNATDARLGDGASHQEAAE